MWLPVLEECDSLDIKILVCDSCVPEENQTGTSKLEGMLDFSLSETALPTCVNDYS